MSEKVISTKKPPTYIIKDLDKEENLEKFIKKGWQNVQINDKSFSKLIFNRSVVMNSFLLS